MKNFRLILLIFICNSNFSFAKPTKKINSQIFNKDLTFYSDTSYEILGNINISENTTLYIEPGTNIYCNNNVNIKVDGTLVANGLKTDSIYFSGNQWCGITFTASSSDWISHKGSVLNFCCLSNINYTNSYALSLNDCRPLIKNTKISNCLNGVFSESEDIELDSLVISNVNYCAIDCRKKSKISNCLISEIKGENAVLLHGGTIFKKNKIINCNGLHALQISSNSTSEIDSVLFNDFIENLSDAIRLVDIKSDVNIYISNNIFKNNFTEVFIDGLPIAPIEGNVVIYNNNFYKKNNGYFIKVVGNVGANAQYNYWGGEDSIQVENYILHKFDDYNLGLISYLPLISDSIELAGADTFLNKVTSIVDNYIFKDFSISPNPTQNIAKVDFSLSKYSNVLISLYNSNGVLIDILLNKKLNFGKNHIDINLYDYPKGLYFINFISGDKIFSQKIVKY
jgi:hypothetical protein